MVERRSSLGTGREGEAGFTLLELTVVVVIISILFLLAYQHYLDLLVDVEKASVEQTVGVLQSAVGMKVAQKIVTGKIEELKGYAGANPMDLLAELPQNYRGETSDPRSFEGLKGIWYFDRAAGLLVYRVKNLSAFYSEIDGFEQARFRLTVIYDAGNRHGFAGLSLRPVESYSWFVKPNRFSPLVKGEKGAGSGG